jgi:hypothetical protein
MLPHLLIPSFPEAINSPLAETHGRIFLIFSGKARLLNITQNGEKLREVEG